MFLGEEGGGNACVGLGHRVLVDHASDVASVAGDLLAADVVRGACNPVLRKLAEVAEDVLIHLGTGGQVSVAHHALLEGYSAQILFNPSRLANLFVDRSRGLSKEIVFARHVARVPRKVLPRPEARVLWLMLR